MAETANGCLVLHRAGTIAERQKPRAEELEKTFHARLLSASGELFSLDKDLSWKSRSGKLLPCRFQPIPGWMTGNPDVIVHLRKNTLHKTAVCSQVVRKTSCSLADRFATTSGTKSAAPQGDYL